MYGAHRFLYQNVLTADQLSIGDFATGVVSGTQKVGTGSALLIAYGGYTGSVDVLITVQIYDISAGVEVGQAKMRWRTSLTPVGEWEAVDIVTSSGAVELFDDVYIIFKSGIGSDFAAGDYWTFKALAVYGVAKLLDLDRSTACYKSLLSVNTLKAEHPAPTLINTVVLFDHNLTSTASVVLQAQDGAGWSPPLFEQTLPVSNPLVAYLDDQTYQYRRLNISDPDNPSGVIRIGQVYMGTYLELSGNADWDSRHELLHIGPESRTPSGVVREAVDAEQRRVTLNYGDVTNTEVAGLRAMLRALKNPATRQVKPVFFHEFSDDPETLMLARVASSLDRQYTFVDGNSVSLVLEEVVKTLYV